MRRPRIGLRRGKWLRSSLLEVALLTSFGASMALTCWLIYDAKIQAQHTAEQTVLSLVKALAGDIQHNLESFERSLDGAVNVVRIRGIWDLQPELRNSAIFDASIKVKNLSGMTVIDRWGNFVAQSWGSRAPAVNVADRDYFEFHQANPDLSLHVSGPTVGRLTGTQQIIFSHRINDSDGNFAGVVAGGIDLTYFRELFRELNLGDTGAAALFSADGRRIMREPFDPNAIGLDVSRPPLFWHATRADSGTFVDRSTYDGVERLIAFSSVGHMPLILTYSWNKSFVFAGWTRAVNIIAASATILWCTQLILFWHLRRERVRRVKAERLAHASATALGIVNRTLEKRVADEVLAREEALERLARAQHMEALGQLAGGIAHDISNVLQTIAGACWLLRPNPDPSQRAEGPWSIILSAIDRGSAVTKRLLAFARRDQLQAEAIDTKALLTDLQELLIPTLMISDS